MPWDESLALREGRTLQGSKQDKREGKERERREDGLILAKPLRLQAKPCEILAHQTVRQRNKLRLQTAGAMGAAKGEPGSALSLSLARAPGW